MTIDFDDGTADQFQTAALFEARGMAGVYFVNSGRIGLTSSYMTADQVKSLQASGNEIGGHTVFHLHLPEQSTAEQQRQICTDRNELLDLGLRITDLAFPFGEYTAATQDIARRCGYDSVRTSRGRLRRTRHLAAGQPVPAQSVVFARRHDNDRLHHRGRDQGRADGRRADADRLPPRLHGRPVSGERDPAEGLHPGARLAGRAAPSRARSRSRRSPRRIGGGVPLGSAHRPPPRPSGCRTPLSKAAHSALDSPTCWEHTVSSDGNVATWSLVHDGHTGNWAEHLDAPTITGGVGLVVAQDLGSCAAPVIVGDRYTYGVWYRSNAPIQLVSYRRVTSGGYLSFGLSPAFAASPDAWSYATIVTRALPAGSTGISIGVAVKTAGQFSFDDFSLVDSGPPTPALGPRWRPTAAPRAHRPWGSHSLPPRT